MQHWKSSMFQTDAQNATETIPGNNLQSALMDTILLDVLLTYLEHHVGLQGGGSAGQSMGEEK